MILLYDWPRMNMDTGLRLSPVLSKIIRLIFYDIIV